jgi:glycine hydroxymethyltransferase
LGRKGPQKRAKVDFETLNRVKIKVRELAQAAGFDDQIRDHGYPHFYYLDQPQPEDPFVIVELAEDAAEAVLQWVTDIRPTHLEPGESLQAKIFTPTGAVEIVVERVEPATWNLTIPSESAVMVMTWLRDLSDGYIAMDDDLHRKAPGPFTVRQVGLADSMPDAKKLETGQDKPWHLGAVGSGEALPEFEWEEPDEVELRRTALYEVHKEMGGKIIPFAGWEMPVWYSSVLEEHLATRLAAGLFDVSHMGVYQVEGPQAAAFLDGVVTNDIAALEVGESCYTQFLNPNAHVIDDTMVYRRRDEMFLVVVNAANDDKDWAWLNAVKQGKVRIDNDRPWARVYGHDCVLRNLRDPKEGKDMRVDIALQGPKSREILLALGTDDESAARLMSMPWAAVMEGVFGGIDLVVSRTGYTGERIAYELFVHPDNAEKLWRALMNEGQPLGLKPVGLGARDSLRTEAGLPLYGHEMAGEMDLGVGDAGFGAYVKTYKPWFIGRAAFLAQEADRTSAVVRFRFDDKGVRMAHTGDPVVDGRGRVIGTVTSCAVDAEGYLLGQAYLELKHAQVGASIAVFQSASDKAGKAPADLEKGDRVAIPTPATVLTRFP